MKLNKNDYFLVDSGNGSKLERFGPYLISRPSAQAVWQPKLPLSEWQKADASFSRDSDSHWINKDNLADSWKVVVADIAFKLSPTDFGHLGIFPEQRPFWEWITETVSKAATPPRVLNLFAYSGGSTLAAAKGGASVCHLDASKGMVTWARENAELNNLKEAPIRWIIDDVTKFLAREKKRGSFYEGIILDPPSFGRGSSGEVFKIEEDIQKLLESCFDLLSDKPLFVLFSCHTPGFTPLAMQHLMQQMMEGRSGNIEAGEMVLTGEKGTLPLPSGTFARWVVC